MWIRSLIFASAALFFLYEFFLRITPSVMVPQLVDAFGIDEEQVGNLSAFYLYSYAPMQLPVGILMDRFGARRLMPLALVFCGLGTVLFGLAETLWIAYAARFLVGFGSSFAFVAMVFIARHWMPRRHLALLIGIGNGCGMVGAFGGEGPFSLLVESMGWRESSIFVGLFGLLFAIAAALLFKVAKEPEDLKKRHVETVKDAARGFETLLHLPKNWLIAILSALFYMTTSGYAGLWAVSSLMQSYKISQSEAGFISSFIYLGWIVGGPVIGALRGRVHKISPLLFFGCSLALLALLPVIYELVGINGASLLLFLVGLFSSAQLLTFTYALEQNSESISGSAIAFVNFVVMLGAAALQPLVGFVLDHSSYPVALSLFPLSLLVAASLSLFVREKNVRERV